MYPAKVKIEAMEEFSEAKIYKSKPELRKGKKMLSLFTCGNRIIASRTDLA